MTTPRRWLRDGVLDVEALAAIEEDESALHTAFGLDHHHDGHMAGRHRGQIPTAVRIYSLGLAPRRIAELSQLSPVWEVGPWDRAAGWGPQPLASLYEIPAPRDWEILTARMHLRSNAKTTAHLAPIWAEPKIWRFGYGPGRAPVPTPVVTNRIEATHAIILVYMRPLR